MKVDLNADIGEGSNVEEELLDLITSASVACGGHTGDRESMLAAVKRCMTTNVRIGAHPSYPDRPRFGRVSIAFPPNQITRLVVEQTRQLVDIASSQGGRIAYIKPHGALYNDAVANSKIAEALKQAADRLDLRLMALAGSHLAAAHPNALKEGFIDRAYSKDGSLVPRSEPGALITDPAKAADQAVRLANDVDSLCVHSDTPGAVELMAAARSALEYAGYEIGYS